MFLKLYTYNIQCRRIDFSISKKESIKIVRKDWIKQDQKPARQTQNPVVICCKIVLLFTVNMCRSHWLINKVSLAYVKAG